jgi:thiamine-monophosphate kinase
LTTSCLFCEPGKHGQAGQVVLRSDSLFVFAGLGAIVDGYLIVTPYTCESDDGSVRSLGSLPRHQLDEIRFLREIISRYYRSRYGMPGMSFEHGRAGACLISSDDTLHCYHPHLCCYPADLPLWEYLADLPVEAVAGVYGLAERVGSAPYLYLEHCQVDPSVPAHMARSSTWGSRVVPLGDEDRLVSQYLRRTLAVATSRGDRWDWRRYPTLDSVRRVSADFQAWLPDVPGLVFVENEDGPRLDFVASVARFNRIGNDAVAERYARTWRRHLQHHAVARFVSRLPAAGDEQRILDLSCGPGIYAKAFHHLGLRTVATDISPRMLDIARTELTTELAERDGAALICMDSSALGLAPKSFAGVWYSAGLVHVPRVAAKQLLREIRDLLVPDGVLYLSAQTGQDLVVRAEGRVFVYYTEGELLELFRSTGFTVEQVWSAETNRGSVGDTRTKVWKHFVLRRSVAPTSDTEFDHDRGTLSSLGERALIRHIRDRLVPIAVPGGGVAADVEATRPPADGSAVDDAVDRGFLILAAGDDAAAIATPPGSVVVATIDPCPQPVVSLLQGPDPWVDGWYSMVINLSDLAAMGATPVGALLAIEAPPGHALAELDLFYDGALTASHEYGCPIIGGNVKDASRFSCVGVAIGHVPRERMLRRDAARPGEVVLVLGTMGVFWAAVLQALRDVPVSTDGENRLRMALRRPIPRVREGVLLASRGWSRCAMDSSDGITACLYEIAGSSGIDLHADLEALEAEPIVTSVARACDIDVRKLLLAWGDWQLVCTADPRDVGDIRASMAELGCPVWEVGWTTDGAGRVWLHDSDGTRRLNYVASERFSSRSYFTHGIERYADILRDQPLTIP